MCAYVQEARLCGVEEELVLKEAHWLQAEARLQGTVTSLEQELELEREQHCREVQQLLRHLTDVCLATLPTVLKGFSGINVTHGLTHKQKTQNFEIFGGRYFASKPS